MDKKAILAVYDKVSGVMGLMVQAAEANDWDAVTELEPQCSAYVDALRASDSHDGLTEDEMQYKMGVIQKILDDDRRIRELAQPWMKELSGLIHSSANSRKVNRAYGANMAS
jgi:Flagellar protein FliT.